MKPVQTRLLSLVGFLVTVYMIFLGSLYPGLFSIVAIPIIPAPFVLGAAIFRPALLEKSPKLRGYLIACTAVSFACGAFDLAWLMSSR